MSRSLREIAGSRSLRIVYVLLAMWTVLAVHPETREAFLTAENFSNLTAQVSEIAIVGVGMTMVILVGGIDLSVGAGMALAGVVAAKLQIDMQQPAWVAVLSAVAVSSAVGAWHGLLVARFSVPPFVATLSGFLAYRGLALVVSDARGLSPMGEDFQAIGGRIAGPVAIALCAAATAIGCALVLWRVAKRRRLGLPVDPRAIVGAKLAAIVVVSAFAAAIYKSGLPVPVAIAGGAAAAAAVILTRTRLGRHAYAIGGNREAARLSGVPVRHVLVAVYVAIGVLTGLAGVVATARTNGVTPGNAGLMRELHVITAVVIGGTSLSGGRGTITGTLVGALVFGTLSNGMNLMGVDSNWQLIVTGQILLAASVLDAWSTSKKR
ncbi:MAG: inner-membrane translocator [Labilithrix sp.]|nr:inner-membrane translocator [Labilithrix sp.]